MNLYEHQAKELFARFGIPVPGGRVVNSAEGARQAAEALGGRVVVKAQVLTGGRGRAGGVRLAASPEEAAQAAEVVLGLEIKGFPIRQVLIEEAAEDFRELYLGLTLDRSARRLVMMASSEGGVEIEEVARRTPEKVLRVRLDPFLGLHDFQARTLAYGLGLAGEEVREFLSIARALTRLARECDATLVEINPLAKTEAGLLALDAKVVLDDNALFRQKALAVLRDVEAEPPAEREARALGLSYVELGGDIGCLVNGAGLAMATMDALALYGGEPANFLDIGGGARAEAVGAALRLLLGDPRVRVVLVNIFGGITRCDEVAKGLLEALEELKPAVPVVVRLAGTKAKEGLQMLGRAKVHSAGSLADAAQLAVNLVKSEGGSTDD